MKRSLYLLIILAMLVVSACGGSTPQATPMSPGPPTEEPVAEATAEPKESPAVAVTDSVGEKEVHLLDRTCDLYFPKGEVEGETIQCGYVRVPWDRSIPDGEATDLAYVVLKATGPDPLPDAIVHVAGGPGAGSTLREVVLEFIQRYAPLREAHDIILYDQRGMGRSIPFFACAYPDDARAGSIRQELQARSGEEVTDADVLTVFCQQDLTAQGYPPSGISTANSAADLNDLLGALGYPACNLYAISYGTRLVMSFMHYFPASPLVRSVVLDSIYPLPEDRVNDYLPEPTLYEWAMFEDVFAECAGDPVCAAAYPDIRERFDRLVEKLDTTPLSLDDGQLFTSEDLYRSVYPYNHAISYIPFQPRLIADLESGNTELLARLRSGDIPSRVTVTGFPPEVEGFDGLMDAFLTCTQDVADFDGMAAMLVTLWDADAADVGAYLESVCPGDTAVALAGLLNAMPLGAFNGIVIRFAPELTQGVNSALNSKLSCTEQYPFRAQPEQIWETLSAAGVPDFLIEGALSTMAVRGEGCAAWQDALTAPTPAVFGEFATLILSGQFDSITPPEMSQIAEELLPHAQLIDVPNAMHSILGNYGACPTQIVQQFLADPGTRVDADCTAGMREPFVLEDSALP